ncbi:MAG TPA: hypothetical protein VEC36_14135 [Patescibacteria group bacterium]|nr:hypothetical protein [Patescibacteria group bacterium]
MKEQKIKAEKIYVRPFTLLYQLSYIIVFKNYNGRTRTGDPRHPKRSTPHVATAFFKTK